jgi:hypothetical protein
MPVMENAFMKIEFRELRQKNYRPMWKDLILITSRMNEKKIIFILGKQNYFT